MKPVFFQSAADFRDWLGQHHATARELLVGFYKKKSGRGITYPEALDEALSFGWIDGVRKRIDAAAYTIRFTPRKPGSIWSAVNIERVRQLTSRGLMQPPGLRVYAGRDERKTRQYSYEREQGKLDPALDAALRADRKASAFFDAQPPGYRKTTIFWVMSAKKEETRARRLAHLIDRSASGARIDLLNPNRQ
jgi:uncharacterized protein YdeI (YjbR/CyaY-like superfamily)